MHAASNNYVEIVKLLLAMPIDINIRNNSGKTTFMYAGTQKGNIETIKMLMETEKITQEEMEYCLCYSYDMAVVKYLVDECKVDINATDTNGKTALIVCAQAGYHSDMEKIQFLLSKKDTIDVNVQHQGIGHVSTALAGATAFGHIEIIRLLLGMPGIDINIRASTGYTPFMQAVEQNLVDVMKCLMEESKDGIDIINDQNIPDSKITSLMIASMEGSFEALKYILVKTNHDSSYIHQKDLKYGCNALEFANNLKQTQCAEYLTKYTV